MVVVGIVIRMGIRIRLIWKKSGHKEIDPEIIARERLQVSAILNIISDAIHNVTDGLAIAAAFMISFRDGCSTTLAVLLHEIPHEIGDLAILVQTGKTKREVIFIQFLTALGAMIGAVIGLFLGTFSASSWIIPFTAGGFIYIATVDVIPQLFDKTDITQTLYEVVAMCIAALAMLLISYVEWREEKGNLKKIGFKIIIDIQIKNIE